MPKPPADPLRTQLLELAQDIQEHTGQLRDFASTPGNAWLARSELQTLTALLGDLENLLEDIKQQDTENGY